MEIKPVAVFHSPFCSKFGIPKQSGIVGNLRGKIVFVPEFRNPDALRGMEEFEYLWLVWEFSANRHGETSLMVRPPRLGGNKKVGVFASRSPFRPNRLGLSSVRIDHIEWETACGPIIHVLGADLMNGTPIYDIKPYVTYADSHPEARSGFVDRREWKRLKVEIPSEVKERLMRQDGMTDESIMQLQEVLAEDPRPQYQKDPQKVYGMPFEGLDIHFCVDGDCLTVI
ncbi:MAG: tRNA (N6-threonylcarbamoyladenosine(37)-N6)-methyltransferase TrmO [Prevotella buccae]|uniref:tRNA (N6-threonylcarbamoyladenosine(37)-N6)-methyltransferase TrmO n=1 Tax=Segatella buccae TaxID=28126 RepID=UPI0001C4167D|nr:tRNA (N6-threonylcarbamoyladenosine(37)-N6)-methyltransferase TrmO [Segatella buccae]EFC76431.1 methyltransferase, YaeB family [Segatella buccae D17]EJP28768.1 methyltransferase, YaeB family [Prevotella sp. MSX73]MBS5896168.1 tRNA (N6-threonylcarbamoyladenosine(37)-N6)-methyltransferase TrmO [Segatella buccae]